MDLSHFFDRGKIPGLPRGLPVGEHIVAIEKIDIGPPRNEPGGTMLTVHLRVVHGDGIDKRGRDFLCVIYPGKPETEEIAHAKLAELSLAAIGRHAKDSSELVGRRVIAVIAVSDRNPKYTEVVAYRPVPPGTRIDARVRVMPGTPEEIEAMMAAAATPPVDALPTPATSTGATTDPVVPEGDAGSVDRAEPTVESPSAAPSEPEPPSA